MVRARVLARAMFRAIEYHEVEAARIIHEWLLPHAPTGCPFCEKKL